MIELFQIKEIRSLDLRPELETLVRLQVIDLEIQKLNEEKAKCPERLEALKEQVATKEAELDQFTERLTEINKHKIEIEDELEMETSRLTKSQQKLTAVKTDREYQALLKEIEEIKKANKSREDEILSTMEEVQSLEETINARRQEVDQARKEMEAEDTHVKGIQGDLDSKISALTKDREKVAKDVRPDLLSQYNFLKEKRAGVVISTVTGGVCNGCHMNIPPQLYNELLRDEKIYTCPTCQRIIYVAKEEEKV